MTAMEQALKAALAAQPSPTIVVKPQMQRIWEWLKDHPDSQAKAVQIALKLPESSVSSLLANLRRRGMVEQTPVPKHKGSARQVLVYRISPNLREYELLTKRPVDKKPVEACAVQVTQEPASEPAVTATLQPSKVGSKDFVEALTVAEARKLYKELHQLFGN